MIEGKLMAFDHEKLDVYLVAVDFIARANSVVESLPRGRGYLADQLQRAASSIVLNVAEGAGKYSGDDKASFSARARGSTTECAALLDVCLRLKLIEPSVSVENKALLERIAQMLTKLIKSQRTNSAAQSSSTRDR